MDWIPRFGLAVVLLWVSVSNVNVTVLTAVGKVEQPSTLADEAREYLGAALALVEEHSIKRDSVDWEVVTAEAFDIARDAQTPSETHEAVRFVLRSLNDAHSGFFDPEQMANMNRTMATASGEPVGRLLADRVGYVRVPTFGSFDLPVVNDFATRLQQVVREVDQGDPCGWIVDLRDNDGGNMWAMLTGIGPIRLRARPEPDRAALHEDDRMVAVLARAHPKTFGRARLRPRPWLVTTAGGLLCNRFGSLAWLAHSGRRAGCSRPAGAPRWRRLEAAR